MGGTTGKNGITLQFFDAAGNADSARAQITQPCCWITGQPQGTPGVGSDDWLKEAYLAPDQESLYALMRTYPPTGTAAPFTSAASLNVTVNYVDANGAMKSEQWQSAIAEGTDTEVTLGDGTKAPLRFFETLKLTQGDALNDAQNKLHPAAVKAKNFQPA